jgi:hypothetical protein
MSRKYEEDVKMQATHGFAVPLRRLIGVVVVALAVVSAAFASTASAGNTKIKQTYFAMGDSYAFGYSTQLFNENLPEDKASAFENGYVNKYNKKHTPINNGIQLVNDGCPGETTDSMIGNGPLAAALGIPGEAPCAYHNKKAEELDIQFGLLPGTLGEGGKFPLHHEYASGTQSQLENALQVLGENALKGTPVTRVSLDIGGNDELNLIKKCREEGEKEAKTNPQAQKKEQEAYIAAYKKASEEGKNPAEANAAGEAAAKKAGEEYAKNFAKECIQKEAFPLFKHILGNIARSLYVLRHGKTFGSVDYTGPIIVQGGYDPYGHLFNVNEEVLPGSNNLAGILNLNERKLVTSGPPEAEEDGHEPFKGCYENPQLGVEPGHKWAFNPPTTAEPKRLQTWTNMTNTSETEFEGKKLKNGPDIHPTPMGYQALANGMYQECG